MRRTWPCRTGREPDPCCDHDICARVPQGIGGGKRKRLCPAHDDTEASLSINPGDGRQRIVWRCYAGCSAEAVREGLLGLGIDESCLGNYGTPKGPLRSTRPAVRGVDLATLADAKRWHAVLKLPRGLPLHLYRMCIQAISDGDGDLTGDPYMLLPVNRDDFLSLAERTGIERSYRYKLWRHWLKSDDWLRSDAA